MSYQNKRFSTISEKFVSNYEKIDPLDESSLDSSDKYNVTTNFRSERNEKKKRTRRGPPHLWSPEETTALLQTVRETIYTGREFEKPTSHLFYDEIKERCPQLQDIDTKVMRSKMRHLKLKFFKSLESEEIHGQRTMCEYFDELNEIYGDVTPTTPPDESNESANEDSLAEPVETEYNLEYSSIDEAPSIGSPSKSSDSRRLSFLNTIETSKCRLATTHRWMEREIITLLKAVADSVSNQPENFEKPTSEKFYNNIKSKSSVLRDIDWKVMKSKLRHLKSKYILALNMQEDMNAIRSVCPHYDILHDIFGSQVGTHSNESISKSTQLSDTEIDGKKNIAYVNQSLERAADDEPSNTGLSDEEIPDLSSVESAGNVDISDVKPAKPVTPVHAYTDRSIQKLRLKLEARKLKLKAEKMRQNFELRKMKIKSTERIEIERIKMELESRERLKRYEIERAAKIT